ncbi:SsgA family sporulation/cell division regulator [Streptomyces tanashiensis]|uniref:SsgA family sporulation/cell division regulator n=1 Tax=Streptomyces tanashiensis TaxID=67367 RepID=A0ABY6QR05_9ACTN|nr:SsgA family sporulation/cell division regulator [Streptomyces tanashiensis]UZX19747.1 SsgA family sporulation/cell division regulator [Streptomyces tanashiensis]
MEQSLSAVACAVTAYVSTPNGPRLPLPAELRYGVLDPYAVRLSLISPVQPPVTWVFARELLTEGTMRPTGSGDVLVVPGDGHHSRSLRVILRNSTGTALIDLEAARVALFLQQTFALVPVGTESNHLDLDGVIHALTGRTH